MSDTTPREAELEARVAAALAALNVRTDGPRFKPAEEWLTLERQKLSTVRDILIGTSA